VNKTLPRPGGVPAGDYLLYVSRFDVYKHHFEVVSAYASLPPGLRKRCSLVLVGECHMAEAARVQRLIAEKRLESQVVIVGAVPYAALPAFYRHARATVFASSCENCPNILLEALGAGRPVVSSNVMPMPEFGGENLAYFSPYDAADIAAKLHAVLTDEAHASSLARAARERSQRYDWTATARETWQSILDLASHASART
jgi:glycosyltransferase involved in cell wall biosynthesis